MLRRKTAPWTVELQKQKGTSEVIARCWREDVAVAALEHLGLEDGDTLTLRRRRRVMQIRGRNLAVSDLPEIPF